MSVIPPNNLKQPLRFIEVPLSKFSDEVVPHHQKIFDQYKTHIHKLISLNNIEQLKRECREKKRTVKQLRDLMYELDTLRTQVQDEDLDQFDIKTLSVRKIIITLINGYTELEKTSNKHIHSKCSDESEKENSNPFEGASQIQIHADLDEIKMKEKHDQLNKVENIHKDVEDLHEMYKNLHDMVGTQGNSVDYIEETVENTQQNVEGGARELAKAHKLKAVAYPVTGAFLGGLLGGPIGMVAGLKVGGIAALGCAIAGYTGGKLFKKMNDPEVIQAECQAAATVTDVDDAEAVQKKDI